MFWLTPRQALLGSDYEKLFAFTASPGNPELIGTGDGVETGFTTPFFLGTSELVLTAVGGALPDTASILATGAGERFRVTFTTPPGNTVKLYAASPDGINADVLDYGLGRAQGLMRGYLVERWVVPADSATGVSTVITGFALSGAFFLIATDLRRNHLLQAYPEVAEQAADIFGLGPAMNNRPNGFKGVLQQASLGIGWSPRGLLSPYDIPATDPEIEDSWDSEPAIFDAPSTWGTTCARRC